MTQNFPHVLILSGIRGDTRRYRALHLYQQLVYAGVSCQYRHISDPDVDRAASGADLLVLHRASFDRKIERLISQMKQKGGVVIYDTDDLIFDPQAFQWINAPEFKDPLRVRLYQAEMNRQRMTMDASDGVLVSTNYLAGIVRALGKPVWVHRNAANLEMLERSTAALAQRRPEDGHIVIGYASGTPTHNRDFGLVAPALREILRRHPQAQLWLIGHLNLDEDWAGWSDRIRRFDSVNWRELPSWLAKLDINLAPLVQDNPFSQSKSEIKYMEAALVGVPTAASATDAFSYAIRPGDNGVLVHQDLEWQAALEQLLDTPRRVEVGLRARKDALARYTPQQRAGEAVATLNTVMEAFKREKGFQFKPQVNSPSTQFYWPVAWEKRPSLLQMGMYSLRNRGLKTLLQQARIYLRRLVSPFLPY